MFNLEEQIQAWRRQLRRQHLDSEALDELENHLREQIQQHIASGHAEAEAFRLAILQLGKSGDLSSEFGKLGQTTPLSIRIALFLWAAAAVALAVMLYFRLSAGKLLVIHIFSIALGYIAAFLMGGLGIYHVCSRLFEVPSYKPRSSALRHWSWVAAAVTIFSLLTGMLWAREYLGHFWVSNPRQTGAFCVAAWLVAFGILQHSARVTHHAIMLLCIIGSLIACMAWFGVGMAHAYGESYGVLMRWPLQLIIIFHVLLFSLGFAPAGFARTGSITH